MQYILKKRVLYLAVIFTAFSFSQAEAQIWGKLKDAVRKKAEEVVTKEIGDKATEKSNQEKTETPQATSGENNSQKQTTASIGKLSSLDIVGLKLGMTPDQVVDFLKKRNKDFKFRMKRHSKNQYSGDAMDKFEYVTKIEAILREGGGKEYFKIIFSDPISENVSEGIMRQVYFKKGQHPMAEAIKEGVVRKYGNPLKEFGNQLLWMFDENGILLNQDSPVLDSSCLDFNLESGVECGLHLSIGIYEDNNKVSSGFYASLADARLIANNKARTQKYIADQKAAEAQKRKEDAKKQSVDTDF